MSEEVTELPPGASPGARRIVLVLIRPLERFLRIQAASGIVLLVAAAVALAWANSPWKDSYQALWDTDLTIGIGRWTAHPTLRFVMNDMLMTIFFFVVGLEIRREMHRGELSDRRRATLPLVAAIGGMIAPAIFYTLLSPGGDAGRGWGVPMATDIAFAVGVLALLGSRVPPSLRVLLLALAIIDDVGAIIVIAVFYSAGLHGEGILLAGAGVAAILLLQRFGVRHVAVYVLPSVVIWSGMLWAGIHPTIAGVVVGLLTPVHAWYGREGFVEVARQHLKTIARRIEGSSPAAHDLAEPMAELRRAQREAVSPIERAEIALHPWVAFGIMPAFAFANAGVDLGSVHLDRALGVAFGVAGGLAVGKLVGVVLASYLTVRLGLAALPRGVTWRGIIVMAAVAGIGFTMALFIAGLAFAARPDLYGVAKVAVLMGSAVAAGLALILGRVLLNPKIVPGAATSVDEAEASTER